MDAKLAIAWHDELILECHEGHVKDVADLLEETMVAGVDGVLNLGLDADHPDRVPMEVDVEVVESWGGG